MNSNLYLVLFCFDNEFVASKGCIKQESKATSGVWQKASLEEV
jgi:hypothetical protein